MDWDFVCGKPSLQIRLCRYNLFFYRALKQSIIVVGVLVLEKISSSLVFFCFLKFLPVYATFCLV